MIAANDADLFGTPLGRVLDNTKSGAGRFQMRDQPRVTVVRQVAERIFVLYLGEIIEQGPAENAIGRPKHPYTKRLIDSIPR